MENRNHNVIDNNESHYVIHVAHLLYNKFRLRCELCLYELDEKHLRVLDTYLFNQKYHLKIYIVLYVNLPYGRQKLRWSQLMRAHFSKEILISFISWDHNHYLHSHMHVKCMRPKLNQSITYKWVCKDKFASERLYAKSEAEK